MLRLAFFFLLFLSFSHSYNHEDFKQIHSEQQLTDFIQSSPLNVLVFVDKQQCNNENDDQCRQEHSQLEQIRDLCTSENIQFALSTNSQIAEKQFNIYGSFPKISYFRDGFPVIYSGSCLSAKQLSVMRRKVCFCCFGFHFGLVFNDEGNTYKSSISNIDSIHEWFGETRERLTRTLDDKSFEHDTQAATGSTTGDWFILFKKSNDTGSLLSVWEATCLQFRNRVIFAYVNVDTNPNIQKRFHLYNLPSFILFKRGKMYRYEGTSWKQTSFVEFVEHDYQKVKGEIVPPEPSAFSFSFGNTAKIIPMYLIVIPMICLAVVLLVLVTLSGFTKKKRTTTTERLPFQVKID